MPNRNRAQAPSLFEGFTNKYSVTKTLRFELKPLYETAENANALLEDDKKRADAYTVVKPILDQYHKNFIEMVLSNLQLDNNLLTKFSNAFQARNREDQIETKKELRKKIAEAFKGNSKSKNKIEKEIAEKYERIFKKNAKLFSDDLLKLDNLTLRQKEAIKQFDNFSTYFLDFQKNRKNMYSEEPQNTAIAHRIVDDNLPKYLVNINAFENIKGNIASELEELNRSFAGRLGENETINDFFELSKYPKVMTQSGIDLYNAVIGSITQTSQASVRGINQLVNEYNQRHPEEKLPFLNTLYKQILSDRIAVSWLPEKFENDQEMMKAIDNFLEVSEHQISQLRDVMNRIQDFDLNQIFVQTTKISRLSKNVFDEWNKIENSIKENWKQTNPQIEGERDIEYQQRCDSSFNTPPQFSLQKINDVLTDENDKEKLLKYFTNFGDLDKPGDISLLKGDYQSVKKQWDGEAQISEKSEWVEKIKNLLDHLKQIQLFTKLLEPDEKLLPNDMTFYVRVAEAFDNFKAIIFLYDKVRNHLTKKLKETKKIKVRFNTPKLLKGWDKNQERGNKCIILRDGDNYYLGIWKKGYEDLTNTDGSGDFYEKMYYKQLSDPSKDLPKKFFSKEHKEEYSPSKRIDNIHDNELYKPKSDKKSDDLRDYIKFSIDCIEKTDDWKVFHFNYKKPEEYVSWNDFCNEIASQAYKIKFTRVDKNIIRDYVRDGRLLLFQIYNKDFSPNSHGKPNLHTIYWKNLFKKVNLSKVVYKLNGKAEVFFRQQVLHDQRITHPANKPIQNKNPNNPKKESSFPYDLVKDKRYRSDKYFFHVPITINPNKNVKSNDISNDALKRIRSNPPQNIIGVDRGERNLLYISVIDMKGRIILQKSLNVISGKYKISGKSGKRDDDYCVDYHALLDNRENERNESRRSWKKIEGIKDLKQGYLSNVIHEISKLMVEHNAILVMEDLDFGFKLGRQKFEKQVYQNFEKQLIEKLNLLVVDKQSDENAEGGFFRAYQITDRFESFEKMRKQSGFIFYVDPWNTSKIDPLTGFVNLFDTKYYNMEKAKQFFDKFASISYNQEKRLYEFVVNDYSCFNAKAADTKLGWTICTNGTRISVSKSGNTFNYQTVVLTDEFKKIFEKYDINTNGDIKSQILSKNDADLFKSLLNLFKLTVQLRNSNSTSGEDYIISPIRSSHGNFFDSRESESKFKYLPQDADANGAYNIARKGLMLVEKIRSCKENQPDIELAISHSEWLSFAQEEKWNNQ